MERIHMLFAPTGLLKVRTPAYHAVHADLRASVDSTDAFDADGLGCARGIMSALPLVIPVWLVVVVICLFA